MSFSIFPWNMGDAAEPDYNGRIQLRNGKFEIFSRLLKNFPANSKTVK